MKTTTKSLIRQIISQDLRSYAQSFSRNLLIFLILPVFLAINGLERAALPETTLLLFIGMTAIVLFVSGCMAGYELPLYVRRGATRKGYVKARTLSGGIVALGAPWIFLGLNLVFNLFVPTHIWNNHFFGLLIQTLSFLVLYFLGFFITSLWGRYGWLPGTISIIVMLMIGNFATMNVLSFSGTGFPGISVNIGIGSFLLISMLLIIGCFVGSYLLNKNRNIYVK